MRLVELFTQLNIFSFTLGRGYVIKGISHNLSKTDLGKSLLGKSIFEVAEDTFNSDEFKNERYLKSFKEKIIESTESGEQILDVVTVTNNLEGYDNYLRFNMGIDVYYEGQTSLVVKFVGFKVENKQEEFYLSLFDDIENEFDNLKKLRRIGLYIADYSKDRNYIYANDVFPELLNIEKTKDNKYYLNSDNPANPGHVQVDDPEFLSKIEMFLNGDFDYISNETIYGDKCLQLEGKALKRDENGKALLVSGILYDVSDYRDYQNLQYIQSIYKLAISSGGIGIFHYDVDKYGTELFEANSIYAQLIGLEENEPGIYKFSDFEKALIVQEEEVYDQDVHKNIEKILSGELEGTTDDILKIEHLQTGDIKYLLSSSKVDSRYPDGTPRRFGGIVIDITDRIQKEKNQIRFAYTDELTRLSNNRKLMKDMRTRNDGVGLFFDLDNFKKVNDKHGHLMGDKVLKLFGKALRKVSQKHENVYPYRLYGDEFFVFLEGYNADFAETFEKDVQDYLDKKLPAINSDIRVEASMGIGIFTKGMDIDDFIKEADYSMYKIKIQKRNKGIK